MVDKEQFMRHINGQNRTLNIGQKIAREGRSGRKGLEWEKYSLESLTFTYEFMGIYKYLFIVIVTHMRRSV